MNFFTFSIYLFFDILSGFPNIKNENKIFFNFLLLKATYILLNSEKYIFPVLYLNISNNFSEYSSLSSLKILLKYSSVK